MRLLSVKRPKRIAYAIIIALIFFVFSPSTRKSFKTKVRTFSGSVNNHSKDYSLVDGLILVNNSDFHLMSDKHSKEARFLEYHTREGETFIHFHYTEPKFSDKIVQIHDSTFFTGYLENRISAIISAAMLWQAKQDSMMEKLGSNPVSFIASNDVKDFAEIIYKPIVDFKINNPSLYIKYDHALILKKKIQKNVLNHIILIRKFKRYFDSVNSVRLQIPAVKQIICTFTTSRKLKTRLKKYLKDVTQISSDMGFQEQAHLFSICDILVTQNSLDIGTAFVFKPKIMIIGLDTDEKWIEQMDSFWNIKVFSQRLGSYSPKSFEAIASFLEVIKTNAKNKFLMFMPWEQLNNQIIGFKAACAISKLLDRILVLPYLGYRTKKEWNFSFDHRDYSWAPMENYFDLVDLPCRVITFSNFKRLHGKRINDVHFNPVAKATSYQQITDYYKETLGLHFTSIKNHSKMSQLSEETILEMFDRDKSKVLSFGSLFWAFGFGKTQDYPLKKYITYMDNDLYKQITKGIIIHGRIVSFCKESIRDRIGTRPLVSVHIRRGDYWNKCKAISDTILQAHCYPSLTDIKQKIRAALEPIHQKSSDNNYKSAWDEEGQYVYISTNLLQNRSELNDLQKEFNILFFEDIYDMKEIKRQKFDPIDMALMDRELDTNSDIFIGNFYSSFSRTIFEARELLNRPFETF